MRIFKATNTLDKYVSDLSYTFSKEEAEVILVGGKPLDLTEFPRLKGVFKTGVGIDNLPFEEAAKRGVKIALPSPATCDTIYDETAAFTCHLILASLYAGCGDWDTWTKVDRRITAERRLLVIGTGRIGGKVVEKMEKLVTVTTFDASTDPASGLEALVSAADCISLHIPLMPETEAFFGAEKLGWMKDGASLVNTARGPVVDEAALYAELNSGRLSAAFDVFWSEPYRGILSELPAHRFIRSPHIASTCKEFLEGAARDFLCFLRQLENE